MTEFGEISGEAVGIDFENYSIEEEIAKYKGEEPTGFRMLVRIHVPYKMELTKGGIIIPGVVASREHDDDKFRKLVGLVIKLGPDAYKDSVRFPSGPYCKVGDWIKFPRASGYTFSHKGIPSIYVNDELAYGLNDDPRDVDFIK